MDRGRKIGLAFLLLAGGLATPAAAEPRLPAFAAGPVYDGADIIPPADERQLNARLREVNAQAGRTVIVVTVPSLGADTAEGYASALLDDDWGANAVGVDQRLLLLVAPNERRVRIQAGNGLRQHITDEVAERVIGERMIPFFKRGAFVDGINVGLYALTQALDHEPADPLVSVGDETPDRLIGSWSEVLKYLLWTAFIWGFWYWFRRDGKELRAWLGKFGIKI